MYICDCTETLPAGCVETNAAKDDQVHADQPAGCVETNAAKDDQIRVDQPGHS